MGKPTLFVPSPNVAEDHQTQNARALADKGAAEMIRDAEAVECGMSRAMEIVTSADRLKTLKDNILQLAIGDAADRVAREIKTELEKI
jgi:UDP-N-acetylglucosamine--N-acetylmuramyl-(pentapeptide) pyrophosphoryl-undecaprenol N-acetylglucosamine transferase